MSNIRPTDRILAALRTARLQGDGWINSQFFLREMLLSQYHARIFDLERRGIVIEHSAKKDDFGFRSYRLAEGPKGIERVVWR